MRRFFGAPTTYVLTAGLENNHKLSFDVASESDIMPRNKIDKPLD